MNQTLETRYRGATLTLEIASPPALNLRINRLQRATASGSGETVLRVSSTLQTDYEWHEFIEGVVHYGKDVISARILANNQELISRQYPREDTV